MHRFITEMYTCVHISGTKWCIVRYLCKIFEMGLFTELAVHFATSFYDVTVITGGELRNGVNGFLTSYATDSVRFSQQILDI